MHFRRYITSVLAIIFAISFAGCTSSLWNRYPPPSPTQTGMAIGAAGGAALGAVTSGGIGAAFGTYAGGVLGAAFGNILQSNYTLVEKLQYNGVQVIQVGDEIKLILPTDRFFMPHSPQLNFQYYPVLNGVGDFIRKFQKISIKIAAYTDNRGSWRRNLALSKEQAQHLMIYLWDYGVDTRLIYAEGYGEKDPIASNATERGRQLNRRVEITLRKIEYSDDF